MRSVFNRSLSRSNGHTVGGEMFQLFADWFLTVMDSIDSGAELYSYVQDGATG